MTSTKPLDQLGPRRTALDSDAKLAMDIARFETEAPTHECFRYESENGKGFGPKSGVSIVCQMVVRA